MDQFYVEDGYVDSAYFEIIVDGGVIGLQPYFAEDYAETGYAEQRGSEFTLYANTDVTYVTGSGLLASAGSLTATVGFAGSVEANIVIAVSTSVTASRSRAGVATIAVTALTTVAGAKTVGFDAAFDAVSSLSATPYRIIETGADFAGVMSASMTAIAFKNHTAALDSHATMTVDADITTDAGGLLEYFAALDAQAARFRSTDSNMVVTTHTSNSTGDLGTDIDGNATLDGSSIFTTTASLTAEAQNIIYGEADLTGAFSPSISAISYIKKEDLPFSGARPWAPEVYSENTATEDAIAFNSFTKKFGTHSLLTNIDNDATPTTNSYVKYYFYDYTTSTMGGASDSWHLEFWARGNFLIHTSDGSNSYWKAYANNNNVYFAWPDDTIASSSYNTSAAFNHIVVKRESSTIKLYLNGTLVDTSTAGRGLAGYSSTQTNWRLTFGDDDASGLTLGGNGYGYIDEFRIVNGSSAAVASDVGYAFSTSTITEPTSAFVNTENTKILLHFDNAFTDDIAGLQYASATLSSAFTQTATLSGLAQGAADLDSAFTQTVAIGRITQGASDFDAVASQLTAAAKVADFFINADIAATLDVNETLYKNYNAWLISTAGQSTAAVKTVDAAADLTGAFTPEITTDGFRRFSADLTATATLDATATRYQPGAADLTSSAAINADAIISVDADAALNSAFTQADVDYNRYRETAIALEVAGAQLSVAVKTADFFVNADITATMDVTARITAGVVVEDMLNAVTMQIDAERYRDADADFSSTFSSTASGVFVTDTNADFVVTATQSADAARTRGFEIDFDAIATQLSVIGKIAPYTAGLDSAFAASATGNYTADSTSNINASASTSVTATRIKQSTVAVSTSTDLSVELSKITRVDATINTSATLTAAGVIKVFNLDQYVYTIPAETRTYSIERETRSHAVINESRTYTIEGT